jgi:methyl-accepting chemotaxis protein
MSRGKLRFPMFLKFLIGCLSLAGLLIIGGTYVLKSETQLRARGNYLVKMVRRLEGYTERVGRGMTGTLELLAADGELRGALASPPVPPAPVPEDPPRVTPSSPDAAAIAKSMHERLSSKNGIQPDLFAVFTTANKLIWTPPGASLKEGDLPELAVVEKVRGGSSVAHRIQLVHGVPYQISALPIRAPGSDRIVGGILCGVLLERYFAEWSEQTDDNPETRMRPTLIDGGRILATSWPLEARPELAKVLQAERFERVTIGQDSREIVRVAGGGHDFHHQPFEGYKGADSGTLGKLYITRSRATLVDPGGKLPWRSIGAGIIASLLISTLMAFWITRPIKQFVKQSRDMLAGETDLNHKIVVNSSDETADLAHNINQLFARLHSLATGVQSAAFQVGASSAEISAASREMLGGLKDQTLKIESSTTAVTELSASIQQVAGNAKEATDVAEQSSTAVNAAVERMLQIRSAVEDAGEKMRELGESSKRIGNIVEVIRQISEQTSMLALNASIEAAHAGEQGRGFAVVADEVSSLARRVGQSAKDIEALIQTVKEQTQAAITSMEQGTREVENGSALVTSTLTGLGQLVAVVKETATAVQEQAMVSDEIARNMDAVRHIATEVLSGSEESVIQAERLHELAFELEESIGGFNLDGSKLVKRSEQAAPPARTLVAGAKKPATPRADAGNRD